MREMNTLRRMGWVLALGFLVGCADDNTVAVAPAPDVEDDGSLGGINGAEGEDILGGTKDIGESGEEGGSEEGDDGGATAGEESNSDCDACTAPDGTCIEEGELNPANPCQICGGEDWIAGEEGMACDDGNACTLGDACAEGTCTGAPNQCTEGAECEAGKCDPVEGCVYAFEEGLPCEDGNLCTEGDTCLGLGCTVGTLVDCDDGQACTSDSCDPAIGCVHEPLEDGTSCDDGNKCAMDDFCNAGICTPGATPLICNDGDPCTTEKCVPAEGCVPKLVQNNQCRPIIDVTFPARAESVFAEDPNETITVLGNVTSLAAPITGLTLNGEPVTVAEDGTFAVEMNPVVGGNILIFETENEVGWTRKRVQSFHWSTDYIVPSKIADPTVEETCLGEKTSTGCWTAYSLEGGSLSWWDADAACVGTGGHLAAIHGPPENSLVRGLADATCGAGAPAWIGLSDQGAEGTWVWSDGSALDFAPWAEGEPNDYQGGEDFVEMWASGEWNDATGQGNGCYVCFVPEAPQGASIFGEMVDPGLGIYLTQEALDDGDHSTPANDFATVLESVFDAFDLNEIIPNPVAQGVEGAGAVYDIYLDNLTNNQPSLALTCINGGFAVEAVISNVSGDFFAQKVGGGFFSPGSLSGTLTLGSLVIQTDVLLDVNSTVHTLEADFANTDVAINNIGVDVDGLFGGLIGGALEGVISDFAVDIETMLVSQIPSVLGPVVGDTLTGLAFAFDLALPSLNPEGEPVAISLGTDFSYADFAPGGGMLALRAGAFTDATVTPYPVIGAPARVGCDGSGEGLVILGEAPLEVTLTDDAINTILLAAWQGGFMEFEAPATLFGDFDLSAFGITDLTAYVSGMLPPAVSNCGPDGLPNLTIGDIHLTASMLFAGAPLDLDIYASLVAEFNLSASAGEVGFGLGEISLVELELTAVQDDQIGLEPLVAALLKDQALPGLLEGLQGDALGGFPLPEIALSEENPDMALTIVPLSVVRSGGNNVVLASLDPNDVPPPVDPGDGGGDGGGDTGGDGGGVDPEPISGACDGPDADILAQYTPDDLAGIGQSCGTGCFFAGNQEQCIADCYAEELGLADGCAACFGASGTCAIDNCASTCASDSQSSGCLACLEDAGCTAAFDTCAYGQ